MKYKKEDMLILELHEEILDRTIKDMLILGA